MHATERPRRAQSHDFVVSSARAPHSRSRHTPFIGARLLALWWWSAAGFLMHAASSMRAAAGRPTHTHIGYYDFVCATRVGAHAVPHALLDRLSAPRVDVCATEMDTIRYTTANYLTFQYIYLYICFFAWIFLAWAHTFAKYRSGDPRQSRGAI